MGHLKEGDIFKLEEGMKVYAQMPEKFIFSNKKFSENLGERDIIVGKLYVSPTEAEKDIRKILKGVQEQFSWNGIELSWEEVVEMVMPKIPNLNPSNFKVTKGLFVVVKTNMTGGGQGHGRHDLYPDGHEVTAKRLDADGSYNPEGQEIRFYQSGSFTAVIKEAEVVGKKEKSFI